MFGASSRTRAALPQPYSYRLVWGALYTWDEVYEPAKVSRVIKKYMGSINLHKCSNSGSKQAEGQGWAEQRATCPTGPALLPHTHGQSFASPLENEVPQASPRDEILTFFCTLHSISSRSVWGCLKSMKSREQKEHQNQAPAFRNTLKIHSAREDGTTAKPPARKIILNC